MKKILSIASIALISFVAVGCSDDNVDDNNGSDETNVKVIAPEGMPAFSIANMIINNDQIVGEGYDVSYETHSVASDVQVDLMAEDADIAIAPSTMAANVYNQTGEYQILGTAVYGTLYLVTTSDDYSETNPLELSDLAGETIVVIGQNATPDLTLQYVLEENNINFENNLSYVGNGSDALAELASNDSREYALLPEPVVTATNSNDSVNLTSKISLNDEFISISGNEVFTEGFPQATLIARTDFIEDNEDFIEKFQDKVEDSIEWLKDDQNEDEIKAIAGDAGLGFPGALLYGTRNSVNYGYDRVNNDTDKQLYTQYYGIFMDKNSGSIGGSVPSNEIFYY